MRLHDIPSTFLGVFWQWKRCSGGWKGGEGFGVGLWFGFGGLGFFFFPFISLPWLYFKDAELE